MTTNPRFLALVAKVDEIRNLIHLGSGSEKNATDLLTRALKGEIMRHEPDGSGDCLACSCASEHGMFDEIWITFPCKPFLDMEREVGK